MPFERSRLIFDPAVTTVHVRESSSPRPDLLCLSHLRWDFVFQRPQHLMTRAARDRRVFFVEEPLAGDEPALRVRRDPSGVWIAVPEMPGEWSSSRKESVTADLVDELLAGMNSGQYVAWYLTPMARAFTRGLAPVATVYDCMDELSAFAQAPDGIKKAECELLAAADLVFTGGWSLYEAKRDRHPHVHPFPSSVDVAHFAKARACVDEPIDQRSIPYPRLGYFGVLDERLDLALVAGIADARPEWQVVLIGPVAKIDAASLPRRPNIHLLGPKPYAVLPEYIAGWNVALMPFALNDATRFISPTKTPEYLAAGRPVVSTPVRDVVRPYGESGLVAIAERVGAFVDAIDSALIEPRAERLDRADLFLSTQSWDDTWARMSTLVDDAIAARRATAAHRHSWPAAVPISSPAIQPAHAAAARRAVTSERVVRS